jgi:alcohol dehydrogenase class IV
MMLQQWTRPEWMTTEVMVLAGIAVAFVLAQVIVIWRFSRVGRTIASYEERLARLSDAIGLLTETTESSFRVVAGEIGRLAARDSTPRASAARAGTSKAASRTKASTSARRAPAAPKRPRTVPEIAAAEELSEGEVRLHLLLGQRDHPDRVHELTPRRPRFGSSPLSGMRE